jgi:hypothetical protein
VSPTAGSGRIGAFASDPLGASRIRCLRIGRVQVVCARSSVSCSDGFMYPRLLRARLLRLRAKRARSRVGVDGEVGAFGYVLAQQAVGVLVGAALPGAVGVAADDARDLGDHRISPVRATDGPQAPAHAGQSGHDGAGESAGQSGASGLRHGSQADNTPRSILGFRMSHGLGRSGVARPRRAHHAGWCSGGSVRGP